MAVLISESWLLLFFHEEEDADALKATADIALDGFGKYADTSAMKPLGKLQICRVSAAVRRRLLVLLEDMISGDTNLAHMLYQKMYEGMNELYFGDETILLSTE